MNAWFGPEPFSRACHDLGRVAVPVDETCLWCKEKIEATDCGYIMEYVGDEITFAPEHVECMMRSVLGSVAHIEKRCSCYVPGSTCNDPPDMSLREAAKAAVRRFNQVGVNNDNTTAQ